MSELKRIRLLLRATFRGPTWHGPAVREVLEGVTAETAAARPIAGAHSIWELVTHVTYWRRAAARALAGETVEPEPPDVENFPPVGDPTEEAWEAALKGLEESQELLVQRLKAFDEERLDDFVAGREYSFYVLLHGVIQHDLYHGGQIALLKRAGGG